MKTRITELLGIEVPVLQAGMGMIARGELAAAVSMAGGLGVIGSAHLSPSELRQEIRLVRERTDRPFGVDILFGAVRGNAEEDLAYSREVQEQVEITLEERVPVLISGLGNPKLAIDEAHAQGMVVMAVVGAVRHAVPLVEAGVDALIGQGHEGGGHTGKVGTMVLTPALARAFDVPVVAAGGIVDGQGLVAALSLGAEGVWMGTRFVASEEAHAHVNYKEAAVNLTDEGTVVTRAHSGKPARLIKNEFTDHWDGHPDEIKSFPQQFLQVGSPASVRARMEGDVQHGSAPAGQGGALMESVLPAGEIVRQVMHEAEETLRALGAHQRGGGNA